MNVNELLDTIEDALEESAGMPLSGGKRIVDVGQIRDYLDEVRVNLPVELRQAQSIVSDRGQLIDSANGAGPGHYPQGGGPGQSSGQRGRDRQGGAAACVRDPLRRPKRGTGAAPVHHRLL